MSTATSATIKRTCSGTTRSGEPCRSWAVSDSLFCMAHDPGRAATMAIARRNGGRARHGREIGPTGAPVAVTVAGPSDVLHVLELELREVLTMERSIARARTVGYLCGIFGTVWSGVEFERRIAALEALYEHQN